MTILAYSIVAALIFFFGCLAYEEVEGVYSGLISRLSYSNDTTERV